MSSASWRRGITVAGIIAMALTATAAQASARPAPPSPPSPPVPKNPGYVLRNVQYVSSPPSVEDSHFYKTATVTCPTDTVVVGTVSMVNNDNQVLVNYIIPTDTTVSVSAYEDETGHSGDWNSTGDGHVRSPTVGLSDRPKRGVQSDINPRNRASASCTTGSPLGLGWSVAGS